MVVLSIFYFQYFDHMVVHCPETVTFTSMPYHRTSDLDYKFVLHLSSVLWKFKLMKGSRSTPDAAIFILTS